VLRPTTPAVGGPHPAEWSLDANEPPAQHAA